MPTRRLSVSGMRPGVQLPASCRDALVARMLDPAAVAARREAVARSTCKKRYDGDSWFSTLLVVNARALDRIRLPWACVMAVTLLWTVPVMASGQSARVNLEQFVSAYNLVLTTLSFLLVFRMNRAAVRFWDCRQMWGKLIEVGRQLTAGAAQHCRERPAARDALAAWTCAFAVASKDLLRGNAVLDAAQLQGILGTADAAAASQAVHMPLYCAAAMRAALVAALGPSALSPAEADAPAAVAVATATHRAACMRTLDVHVDELIGQVGGMERIRATPLPLVYVTHLRTFLLCYLLFMPLVYVSHWRWGTIPAMALVSFALLGVEGAAAECESPFEQRANHLAMDAYAAALIANVAEILAAAEVHAAAPWAQPYEAQQREAQAPPAPRLSLGAKPLPPHAAIAMPPR